MRYIKQHKRILYTDLLTSGKPSGYLAEVDKQAKDLFFRVVKEVAESESVTERLKDEDQMMWVGRMNAVREAATEIVNNELAFA